MKTAMQTQYPDLPADCGRRLIPAIVDQIASSDPQKPFISIPRSLNLQDGFADISYKAFADAVNKCSWWLEKELGRSKTLAPIFYIGPLDLRYLIVLLAAVKTGHVVSVDTSTFFVLG